MHNSATFAEPAITALTSLSATPAPPPGLLVADHFVQPLGYYARRPHGTRDWLLTYTRAGEGYYQVGGQRYLCHAGDVVILGPGAPHDYGTATAVTLWDFYWAHFTPRSQWLAWLQWPELAAGLRVQAVYEAALQQRIEQVFWRLLRDNQGLGAWQTELAANALEEVLLLVAQQQASSSRLLDGRVEQVTAYLRQHFHEHIDIPALAALVMLSPSRLAHLFKRQMGVAPLEMVMSLRLHQAARLLEFTNLSVGEVAQQVGFQSAFYFSRQFKGYYGRSPLAYRQQVLND